MGIQIALLEVGVGASHEPHGPPVVGMWVERVGHISRGIIETAFDHRSSRVVWLGNGLSFGPLQPGILEVPAEVEHILTFSRGVSPLRDALGAIAR